jgi:hypothetical protein
MYHTTISWHLLALFLAVVLNIHPFNQTPVLQFQPICSDLCNLPPNRIPLKFSFTVAKFENVYSSPQWKANCVFKLGLLQYEKCYP